MLLIVISRMKLNKVKMWMIDLKLILYICIYILVFSKLVNCFFCFFCGLFGGGFAVDGLGICITILFLFEFYYDNENINYNVDYWCLRNIKDNVL